VGGRRTDRNDEASSRFSQFCGKRLKNVNSMAFTIDTEFVLCEVRTLHIIIVNVRGNLRVTGCNGADYEK